MINEEIVIVAYRGICSFDQKMKIFIFSIFKVMINKNHIVIVVKHKNRPLSKHPQYNSENNG